MPGWLDAVETPLDVPVLTVDWLDVLAEMGPLPLEVLTVDRLDTPDAEKVVGFRLVELDEPPTVNEPDVEALLERLFDSEARLEELDIDAGLELDDFVGFDTVLSLADPE